MMLQTCRLQPCAQVADLVFAEVSTVEMAKICGFRILFAEPADPPGVSMRAR